MKRKAVLLTGAAVPMLLLGACGGDSAGGVASTPAPAPAASPPPPPPPPPPPSTSFDTTEYRNSNAAVRAQAITAYNAGATGAGVVVGVVDSGVNAMSAEFSGRISSASADFAGSRGIQDEGGHGTAVSGVLLAGKNDSGMHGVAFAATLFVGRSDTPGSCTSAGCSHNDNAIAAALDGAVAARARVVNISLGGSPPNSRLRLAIDRATAAGTIIVFSAGNVGVTDPANAGDPDLLAQIANDPISRGLVIIAGAVDSNGVIADFSNRAGNSANNYIAALGVRVRSFDQNGTSFLYTGTSFSAPVVAGAAALLAQAFPTLTAAQIVDLLYRSADDRGTTGVDATYGRGELNIARAFSPIGSLSLAGSAVPVSTTGNATLGGAMGDGGQGGLSLTIRDEYGRDFDADLSATIRRTPLTRPLDSGLAMGARSLAASSGRATFAIAIDGRAMPERLMLSSTGAEQARVLAGAMSLRLSPTMRLAIAGGRGADGLMASATDSAPAFLVSDRALDRAPRGAFAFRRGNGPIGLTLSAESGDLRLWQVSDLGPRGDRWQRYGYGEVAATLDAARGPLAASARLSRFREDATVLGGQFGAALGGGGATSWFVDARAAFMLDDRWRIAVQWRQGWTAVGANGVRAGSTIVTRALGVDVERRAIFGTDDSLALRYSEPLRVTGGGLALGLSGVAPQLLSLAPSGHERDWEMVYARPLGPGRITANAYWRLQPGHYARAPDDKGIAVRYGFEF